MLLILILVFVALTALGIIYILHSRAIMNAYRAERDSRHSRLEGVFSSQSRLLSSFAHDYGYWNEMAQAVETGDITAIQNNVEGSLQTFAADQLWVVDKNFGILYSANRENADDIELTLDPTNFSAISANDQPHAFYLQNDSKYIEFHVAPIMHQTTTDRNALPTGYFLVARNLDDEYLSTLSDLLDANVSVDKSVRQSADDTHSIELHSWENRTIGFLHAEFSNTNMNILADSLRTQIIIMILSAFFALPVIFHLLNIWVSLPTQRLIDTLMRSKRFAPMTANPHESEFTVLSKLIHSYLEQDTQLLHTLELLEQEKRVNEIQKSKLQAILDNMPVGVMLISVPDARLEMINKKGIEIFDEAFSVDQQVAHYYERIDLETESGDPYPTEELPTMIALKTGEQVTKKDIFVKQRNGRRITLMTSSVPLEDMHGHVHSALSVFYDFTKEHEIDRMKTEFISMASHQLRTPLSAMRWFGELLFAGKAGALNDKQQELLQNLYDSTLRMIALVNTLLNISRLESGRLIVEPVPTNLHELVQKVLVEFEPRAQVKQIALHTDIDSAITQIPMDPKLIHEVYANLIGNAVKYTPEHGKISIQLRIDGESIVSSVHDTGVGIPQNQQEKVFSKFFRAQNVTQSEPDGTGLGLYLCKLIVESSGGRIWFESSEGKGTTFFFTLPKHGMKQKKGEVSLT